MHGEYISLIIPTKDRPEDMKCLLESIRDQSRKPNQIIIVDGSDNPIKEVIDRFSYLNIDYIIVPLPSSTRQRNVGIRHLSKKATWVGIFDDDIVLEKDAIEEVLKTAHEFKKNKKPIGGISMNDIFKSSYKKLQTGRMANLIRRIFFLDSPKRGIVTMGGVNVKYSGDFDRQFEIEWIAGGMVFWKKEVLDKFSFDEWYTGYGLGEDLDFSYRVWHEYSLVASSKSHCRHLSHPINKNKLLGFGIMETTNRWYFTRKFKNFNSLIVLYSLTGMSVAHLCASILYLDRYEFKRFLGNAWGMLLICLGRGTTGDYTWFK